tara:strand:- start:33 stop:938 length:906 start_codon:yes stop_codon:yes gene_type:complete
MLLTDFSQLDTSKYTRFFAIGCSFTEWYWPTWANIIAEQNPHLAYHCFAKAGQGNTYISTILNQLSYTHNLCETDLVGVMWSTFHRLDYYTSIATGSLKDIVKNREENILKNSLQNWGMHSDSIHAQLNQGNTDLGYCDRGFLIRDLAIIDNTTTVMQQAPYTAFQMYSVEPEQQNNYDLTLENVHRDNDDVIQTYCHLKDQMASKTSLFNEMGNTFTNPTVTWTPAWEPENSTVKESDFHPCSSIYCQFLQNNGYLVTQSTIDKCKLFDAKIQQIAWCNTTQEDKSWPYKVMSSDKPWPL